jgi:Secretory lipase
MMSQLDEASKASAPVRQQQCQGGHPYVPAGGQEPRSRRRTTMYARRSGWLGVVVAVCTFVGGAPQVARASSAGPPAAAGAGATCTFSSCPAEDVVSALPTVDPFYRYSGDLAGLAPGTVLKNRSVALNILDNGPSVRASQVLYRTTGELGQPAATVATIIEPRGAGRPTAIVSYQDPYDGLGPQCDPSYNLRAEVTPVDRVVTPGAIREYLAAGFGVIIPDYEEEQFADDAGQEEGYATLDGVRAAERQLGVSEGATPVALVGFSGGATATDYATELARNYAPALDIVGAAEDGVGVDYAHNIGYVNGSADWSEVIPAALVGLSRAFRVDLDKYLSAVGREITAQVAGNCLGRVALPPTTLQELFMPQYRDIFAVPVFAYMLNRLIMSRTGTPKGPLFLANGNSDGTGDGVTIGNDVEALAHTYCQRGVSVQFHEYQGLDHGQSFRPFSVEALAFVTRRLHGLSVANGCRSIGAGSSLAPLKP